MDFPTWVRAARERLEMSQAEFGECFGTDQTGVSRLEHASTRPHASTVWAIAAGLAVPPTLLQQLAAGKAIDVPLPNIDVVQSRQRLIASGTNTENRALAAGRWIMAHADELRQLLEEPKQVRLSHTYRTAAKKTRGVE